tara:strand:- start:1006 stop:1317 length:312 start_codon:yes stop_codon:yes gene_type:complete
MHQAEANELAKAPGTYNIPFGAKLTPPPEAPEGMVALASGETWTLVEDHREEDFYRVDTDEKYELGVAVDVGGSVLRYFGFGEIPSWLTLTEPEAPPEAPSEG